MRKDVLESSRKMKKKRVLRGFLIFGAVVLVLIFAFAGLARISYFKIKKVAIEGNATLGSEELMSNVLGSVAGNYFFIFPKNNILLASSGKIEEKILNDFPRIRTLNISKNLPDLLLIKIEERKPTAQLCNNIDCYFIDENGFAFEKSPSFSGNIFMKFTDERDDNSLARKQLIPEGQFKGLMVFINSVSNNKDVKITDIVLKKEGIYNLNTQEGWQIIMSERNDFKIAADNLRIVLESQIKDKRPQLEYIDLRLANKVFYKFK